MSAFDLRGLIRDVLAKSDESDPGTLADLAFGQIGADDYAEALRQALRTMVLQGISQQRMSNPITPSTAMPSPARSWKVAAIRDDWQRALRNRINVAAGEWKSLAECTRDDLLFASASRSAIAEKNAAVARSYNALAALLTEHDAETVGALPTQILMQAIGRAA